MSLLRRALTGASATALLAGGLLAGGAAPAAATTSGKCAHAGSLRLFTANDGEYKVWVQTVLTPDGYRDTHLCFAAGTVTAGAFVVREPYRGALVPTVTPVLADPACPRLLELQDPVRLMTRLAQNVSGTTGYVCFGVADSAFRVSYTRPSPVLDPDVSLFLDKGTVVAGTYCATVPSPGPTCSDPTSPFVTVARV